MRWPDNGLLRVGIVMMGAAVALAVAAAVWVLSTGEPVERWVEVRSKAHKAGERASLDSQSPTPDSSEASPATEEDLLTIPSEKTATVERQIPEQRGSKSSSDRQQGPRPRVEEKPTPRSTEPAQKSTNSSSEKPEKSARDAKSRAPRGMQVTQRTRRVTQRCQVTPAVSRRLAGPHLARMSAIFSHSPGASRRLPGRP
jgi:hypothetical protein